MTPRLANRLLRDAFRPLVQLVAITDPSIIFFAAAVESIRKPDPSRRRRQPCSPSNTTDGGVCNLAFCVVSCNRHRRAVLGLRVDRAAARPIVRRSSFPRHEVARILLRPPPLHWRRLAHVVRCDVRGCHLKNVMSAAPARAHRGESAPDDGVAHDLPLRRQPGPAQIGRRAAAKR
jgi:hypothetical protein